MKETNAGAYPWPLGLVNEESAIGFLQTRNRSIKKLLSVPVEHLLKQRAQTEERFTFLDSSAEAFMRDPVTLLTLGATVPGLLDTLLVVSRNILAATAAKSRWFLTVGTCW